MKLRHAAVLAGWYLIMPSPEMAKARQVDESSLIHWHQIEAYESATQCEAALGQWTKMAKQYGDNMEWAMERARCIASDDPRLKEK